MTASPRASPEFGRELEGLHVLAAQSGNFPGVLTRGKPVRTLADFKGLRLRAPGETVDVLRDLGADPVNMPMGEVYSALAKGVIDGVVAPADTIKSLHFAEVARHFTTIRFPRGAYPARAMSDRAWQRLPPDLQALLTRSRRIWEAALEHEILAAEAAGVAYARDEHMVLTPIAPTDQAAFDAMYIRDAGKLAAHLHSVGLNGTPVLAEAQRLITRAGTSDPITCPTTGDGSTS